MNSVLIMIFRSRVAHQNTFICLLLLTLHAVHAFGQPLPEPNTRAGLVIRSWVEPARYSGRPDSLPITPDDYRQLTYELQAFRATRSTTPLSIAQQQPYLTVNTPRNNIGNRVPLSLLHWKRTVGALTPDQQDQARSTGITPEPFITNVTFFAVSPVKPTTYRGASLKLTLSAEDVFDEADSATTLQSLRIDAGDGNGWQPLVLDEPVNVSYGTTGMKMIEIEAELSDGTFLQASAQLDVAALATPDPTLSVSLAAAAPYNNTTGTLYIYKSGGHTGLRCPVLVAEGFDMQNNMDADVLYNIMNEENLAETLNSYGRDLLVLDYTNATRNIFENAALARAAMQYVNAHRLNASDTFAVIGASMGGLVTRLALADMELNPATYGVSDVDVWISFDSPHKGANIPLGIQEFLKFFHDKSEQFAEAENLYNILNFPAAKQMLLVHHASTPSYAGNSDFVTFQNSLNAKGYPNNLKKIAISNGSGYGVHLPFNPGERIINWQYEDWLEVTIDGDIYALSTVSAPTVPLVFYGYWDSILPFDEDDTTQRHYYDYALDSAPGGTRDSFQVLFDSTASKRGPSDYCLWPDHCFIPMVSSLGISMAYCNAPLYNDDAIKALSPFDEIHFAYTNEAHIDINANNKRWFIRALLEDTDTDSDGFDDYEEYLMGTAYDSAVSKLHVTSQVTIASPSDGLLLSWDGLTNVSYKIYFAETLVQEWMPIDAAYWFLNGPPGRVESSLPMTTPTGFYKIRATVVDPVTD